MAEGGYADIFRVTTEAKTLSLLNNEEQEYALKRMFIPSESSKNGNAAAVRKAFECEVRVLSSLPHCDNLIGMVDQQENQKLDGKEVFILLEYCPNGTLFDLIESKCKLGKDGISDEAELYKILNDISNGLRVLHGKSIAHRDLKIENVLQGEDFKWKICDFGSCTTQ